MLFNSILRSYFKKGKNNVIKVLSLGAGLAVGLVLIAKVYFEQSYDDFFPDRERIYIIQSNFSQQESETEQFSKVSGAIAPGMKAEVPEVELATRYTYLADGTFYDENRNKYSSDGFMLADSCLFDMFPRPVLAGNAKETLSRPMYALVAASIAERMGGVQAVMGKTIEIDSYPGKRMTVGGVFEDFPENSHLGFDVVVSLSSISNFMYDGMLNWLGNDRYLGYVKLTPGTDPAGLAPAFRRMQENNQPMKWLEEAGVELNYTLLPLLDIHSGTPEARRMANLLALLAFAILFTAVMNYVLIVVSSLVRRSKEMAVNKCYGASPGDIYGRMFAETLVHLVLAAGLAALLILAFRETVVDLLDASLAALFSFKGCLVLAGVFLLVFVVSGLAPGYLFARIPVSSAFRSNTETRRFWKLGLLFVQFMAAGFLVTLVAVITRQYDYMLNDDPGYAYENLAYCNLVGTSRENKQTALDEIGRMPGVAAASTCSELPSGHPAGNNILLPDDSRDLFNVADFYDVGNGYFDLMEIPVIDGRSFTENVTNSTEVMVNRSFVERMQQFTDWSDGAVGKAIRISEHSQEWVPPFTICGVYEDFRIGSIENEDSRPSIMFYNSNPSDILLVKYHRQTPEGNAQVSDRLKNLFPDKDVELYSYPAEMRSMYDGSRKFRNAVLIGSLVALLISLIGLTGYTSDEMNRRRKEVAIRKINGATISDMLRLFLKDILRIALPAVVLAGGIAYYVAQNWQEQFTEKAPVTLLLLLVCGVFVLAVIQAMVSLNCYRAATENPAESIKSE